MGFTKKPLVPNYIYAARVNEEDICLFEDFFYSDVEFYPEEIKSTPERFEFAKRIGYGYMKLLRDEVKQRVPTLKVKRLGDERFEWRLIGDLIDGNKTPIAVCVGAGTDISFETQLAEEYPSAKILLLDPSPQAVAYVKSLKLTENLKFLEVGLADEDKVITFHKPSTQGLGSLSIYALHPSKETYDLPVKKLKTILEEENLDCYDLDYLKFDIEGVEHSVVESLITDQIRPKQIAFEFDQPVPPWTIEKTLKKLYKYGYELIDVWGLNVLLVDSKELK